MGRFLILYNDSFGIATEQVGCSQGVSQWIERHQHEIDIDRIKIVELNRECSLEEFVRENEIIPS